LIEVLREVQALDNFPLDRLCRWNDVLEDIANTQAQDEAKAGNSALRTSFRKAGPEIAVLESLTNLFPDPDGLSVLRGGLSTLFKVGDTSSTIHMLGLCHTPTNK
jgi:hypothetical protein